MQNGKVECADPICAEVDACASDDRKMNDLLISRHGRDVAIHALSCKRCDTALRGFFDRNPPPRPANGRAPAL